MKLKNENNRKYYNLITDKELGYYVPIIFIISVLPLIFHGKVINLPIEEANFWKGGIIDIDFFCYYKSLFLIIATLASLIAYGGLYLNNRLPLQNEKKYYVLMLIYLVMVLLSTLMSQYKHVSVVGFINMYQGIFVLYSYIVLMFILINYIRGERDIKIVMNSFIVLVIVEGIIGLSQYFGYDFFKTTLGQWLISPNVLKGENLGFTFGKYTIYGTMYNTNFVGSFGALVLPLTTILYINEKDKRKSIAFGFVSLLAFATWLGCNSRAGYLGITVAFIIGIIVFRKIIKRQYKKVLIISTCFILITIIFNTVSGGRVLRQFTRLNPVTEAERIENINKQQEIRFEEVSIKDNTFTVRTNKETLIGYMEESHLKFKDENGKILGVTTDKEGKITFIDEKYSGYSFTLYEDMPSYINADIYGRNWDLYVTEDQSFNVISFNNKLAQPVEAPRCKLFDGRETFASNRGYIWSRTIPMLKDTLIIGYGPDNYPLAFPQEDYVGRFNVGNKGMTDIVIDKPHNMYLQTAINTGVISLLALMAIWIIYLFDSFIIYKDGNMESFTEYMGAATFLSIIAYLVAGLFNDNVVSVAPLFWILLGMGIGINGMIKTAKL
ncbi:MAG TPA: O-antigen ligase family protein [Tissierellia bacterium]|nr:O-antigen ligase family protein [Tissierellia bacterium]